MMKAIETNPKTSAPPLEGIYKLPYRTGYKNGQPILFEGEPLND